MEHYKSILVICKLKKNAEGDALVLDLPFKVYGQNIVMLGKSITYRLHDLKNDKKEVLAKVDYCIVDHPSGGDVVDESAIAEAFTGNIGQDWSKLKKNSKYTKHYNVKKRDALAKYDEKGKKTPYNGADKDDIVKFCQWRDEVAEAKKAEEDNLLTIGE